MSDPLQAATLLDQSNKLLIQAISLQEQALKLLRQPMPAPIPFPSIHLPSDEPLAWGAKVSPYFRNYIRTMARDFSIAGHVVDPNWFMACIAFETMESFSPTVRPIRNGKRLSSAVGLIQFMDATARDLGTTTDALAALTADKQLDFVWLYFKKRVKEHGFIGDLADTYMAIHWPAAMGKPMGATMYASGSSAYAANSSLDTNHDHLITKAEAAALVAQKLAKGLQPAFRG